MKHGIALGIFLLCFSLSCLLSPQIGVSWDEPDNIFAAGVYINFFQKGMDPSILASRDASASYFQDKIFTQEPSLQRYPPFPLYIGSIIVLMGERLFGSLNAQQIILSFHLASGLFWSLLAVSIFYITSLFGMSLLTSLTTTAMVSLHPTLFGYGLSTIKDSAQVSLFVTCLLFLILYEKTGRVRFFVISSLLWGTAMATKINAVYIPVIWGTWKFLNLMYEMLLGRKIEVKKIIFLIRNLIIFVSLGGVVCFVLWPYLWFDPIKRVQEVFFYFTTVGTGYKVFWQGTIYMTGVGLALPWYPVIHMFIGTPIPLLLVVFLGLMPRKPYRKWWSLLFIWISIPLFRTLSGSAAFYDGMRHFLEVVPAFVLLSSGGIERIGKFLSRAAGNQTKGTALVALGLVTYFLLLAVSYFPYGMGYVNAFIKNPNENVERDYGGLAIAESVRQAHILYPYPARIFIPIAGHLSWYYLSMGDTYVYRMEESDVLILINKPTHVSKSIFDTQVYNKFDLKHAIMRGNDAFAWIYVKRK